MFGLFRKKHPDPVYTMTLRDLQYLKQRIADIEKPFKYKVGDGVVFNSFHEEGQTDMPCTVVSARIAYRTENHYRENAYLVFTGERSFWAAEEELKYAAEPKAD